MNPTPNSIVSQGRSSDNGRSHDAKNPSTSSPWPVKSVLTEEMLARFASRAASYDQENRFFAEDFEELRAAKYLLLPVAVGIRRRGPDARSKYAGSNGGWRITRPRLPLP